LSNKKSAEENTESCSKKQAHGSTLPKASGAKQTVKHNKMNIPGPKSQPADFNDIRRA